MPRLLGCLACLAVACGGSSRAPVANQLTREAADHVALLREIGSADEDTDRLAAAYVARGSDAVLVAANVLLAPARDDIRDRGARHALMSLTQERDFRFVTDWRPQPSAERSCAVTEVLFLIGQSAQSVEPMPRPFAQRLVALLDETWPTCNTRVEGREPGYSHPHVTALMILNERYQWSSTFDGSLARDWATHGAEHVERFKTWWRDHPPH